MSKREAYTLLEMMIVMTIVVLIMAIAWPRMRGLAAKTQVREAAVDFKAACAEARDLAVRRGQPIILNYQFGRSDYRISDSPNQQFDADDVIQVEATSQRAGKTFTDKPLDQTYELSSGILFDDPANRRDPAAEIFSSQGEAEISNPVLTDLESLADEDKLVIEDQRAIDWTESESITFYPEGRCTSSIVRLLAPDTGESITVTIRGLTSGVSIGPVEKAPLDEADLLETQVAANGVQRPAVGSTDASP